MVSFIYLPLGITYVKTKHVCDVLKQAEKAQKVTYTDGILCSLSGVKIIRLSSDETKVFVGFESGDVCVYEVSDFAVILNHSFRLDEKCCSQTQNCFWDDY